MKFDSFTKYAGGYGSILTAKSGDKWLFFEGIGMKIPMYCTVCGTPGKMSESIEKLLYEFADFDSAKLTDAYLPEPYSKPSEVKRVFSGGGLNIDITNKAFGFIEKKDHTYINEYENDDGERYTVLLVSDMLADGDAVDFKMVYVVKEVKEDE